MNGQMLIFGGYIEKKQISMVEKCGLKRIGTLPMEFYYGACNTYPIGQQDYQVLLCFAFSNTTGCHRYYLINCIHGLVSKLPTVSYQLIL